MWILYVISYVIVAYFTFVVFRNNYITVKYREYLGENNDLPYREWALKKAKASLTLDAPFIGLAAAWWVVCLPCFVLYRIAQSIPKLTAFRSGAEKEVDALKANQALAEARKTEWDNALQTMEDAGIDTKELRKIRID